jgi:hypothetical protein
MTAAKAQIDRVHDMLAKIRVRGTDLMDQPALQLESPVSSGDIAALHGASALTKHGDSKALDGLAGASKEEEPLPFVDLQAPELVCRPYTTIVDSG